MNVMSFFRPTIRNFYIWDILMTLLIGIRLVATGPEALISGLILKITVAVLFLVVAISRMLVLKHIPPQTLLFGEAVNLFRWFVFCTIVYLTVVFTGGPVSNVVALICMLGGLYTWWKIHNHLDVNNKPV